jgi:hypothetical protein
MSREIEFKKVIPITKASMDDTGDLFIEGKSSGPEIDLDKQFMTPECIEDMAKQVNETTVPFGYYDEHNKRGILSELGEVVEADVTPEYHMKTKVRLDKDNPAAVTLWKKVDKGKQYGMSIAGHVVKPVKKVINGVLFQGFNRIRLDHIANTTKPSWAPSLGTLVAKSLEQDGFDWADAPEYEGDLELPFSAHVEKRSKPDPQAGKWYTLAADILNRLNTVFGWESYQDKIDETNRDIIPFKDLPLAAKLPVGAVELSADDYDADPEGYIEKATALLGTPTDAEQPAMEIGQMAELYERLYFLAESLGRRDEQNGTRDGKKTITKLRAAMKAVADAMKEMLSKAQPPEPLTYGEEPDAVQKVKEETTVQGDNVLKDFADAAKVGQKSTEPRQPQPSVEGGTLTDFSQVADVAQQPARPQPQVAVAKTAGPDDDLDPLLDEFGEAMRKAWVAEAPVGAKHEVLAQIFKAFVNEVGGRLESQRPEEERIEKAVRQAVAPLVVKIEQLEAQIAVAKSQPQAKPAGAGDEEPLVRKSFPGGRNVVLQPARFVQKSDQKPTFVDLVTGQGGLLP